MLNIMILPKFACPRATFNLTSHMSGLSKIIGIKHHFFELRL